MHARHICQAKAPSTCAWHICLANMTAMCRAYMPARHMCKHIHIYNRKTLYVPLYLHTYMYMNLDTYMFVHMYMFNHRYIQMYTTVRI